MAILNLLIKMLTYSDEDTTVAPQTKEFDWTRELNGITVTKMDVLTRALGTGDATIALPNSAVTFLYIECDQQIYIKLNGDTGTTVIVSPGTAGEMEGVFLKRGQVTSLVINNPSLTATANVKIFVGV